jgi:hypothetical protein
MGTNYYVKHADGKTLHIGKSSGGWCFSLHVIPEKNLNTLDDWKYFLNKRNTKITNEYEETLTLKQLLSTIEDRKWNRVPGREFNYDLNGAEPGPNGLVRHIIDGIHCVGHGSGTWDYIAGTFS